MTSDDILAKAKDACEEMKRLILDYEIPEGIVRRCTSFEVAEYILHDHWIFD